MTMANTTMKISLPEELKREAEQLAEEEHYSSTSGFIQHLIRTEADKKRGRARLEHMLAEGLESGISSDESSAIFSEVREKIRSKQ